QRARSRGRPDRSYDEIVAGRRIPLPSCLVLAASLALAAWLDRHWSHAPPAALTPVVSTRPLDVSVDPSGRPYDAVLLREDRVVMRPLTVLHCTEPAGSLHRRRVRLIAPSRRRRARRAGRATGKPLSARRCLAGPDRRAVRPARRRRPRRAADARSAVE